MTLPMATSLDAPARRSLLRSGPARTLRLSGALDGTGTEPGAKPGAWLRYRSEIDGLRAVAVVSVLLFHGGLGPFSGGFVGVDVFFVISGYLITATIVEDLEARRFSLTAFYERRARRLLPALFVVMAACAPFAYLWMLPNDLDSFGQSLAATSLFLNNALLLHTSGYWSLPAEFKPLLHTWSLGIEEQYYLLFPLLMLAMWRFLRSRIATCLIVIAAASLAAALWLGTVDRIADFYLAPTRAWEFLAGSLVLFAHRRKSAGGPSPLERAPPKWTPVRRKSARQNRGLEPCTIATRSGTAPSDQVLSAAGLMLLAFSILCFRSTTPTPSLYTLAPVCGAALVLLFASQGTAAHRLLTHRVPVGIGLISYSLYLWHLPLIAFARIYSAEPPSRALVGALLALAVPLAYLSWRLVEQPFRSRRTVGRTAFVSGAILLSAAFIGYGSFLHLTRGLPGRLSPQASADDLYIDYNARVFDAKRDAFTRPDALHVLVVGNSYARDFVNMTTETFDLSRVEIVYRDDLGGCLAAWTAPLAASLLRDAAVIVFASRSLAYGCVGDTIARADALAKTLFYAGGKHFGVNLNWIMRLPPGERRDRDNPLMPLMVRQEAMDAAAIPSAHYISLLAPIVRDGRIPITDGQGRLLTQDRKHLTRHGARYLGARVLREGAFGKVLQSF